MMFLSAWAQNDEMTREQADKLDSLTIKLMNQERYEDAIKAKERELTILKTLYGEKDTTYIRGLAFCAKIYYRNRNENNYRYESKNNDYGCDTDVGDCSQWRRQEGYSNS